MTIVLAAYLRTHFRALMPQACWLAEQGHKVTLYLAARYRDSVDDAAEAHTLGFQVIQCDGREYPEGALPLWHHRKEPVAFINKGFIGCTMKFRAVSDFYHRLFGRIKPDVIILPEENVGYLSHLLVRAAHAHGARAVVMPYTIDKPNEAAETFLAKPAFQVRGWLRQSFARKHPHWVHRHKDQDLLRLPFPAAATMEWLKMAPPAPWRNLCAFSDAVAFECQALANQAIELGLPADKIQITGSRVLDEMAEIRNNSDFRKADLLEQLGLNPNKPIFLAALPPDIFKSKLRSEVEFQTHKEATAFWLDTLAATGWNVIVNPHPHLNPANIDLGGHSNVRLCLRPVSELLPLCDVFVACISATIRWAIACAKPVLNHDLYRFDYPDYRQASGVVHVQTRTDFQTEVTKLGTDTAYRSQLAVLQSSVAMDWGILDGGSSYRLAALFTHLITLSPTTSE